MLKLIETASHTQDFASFGMLLLLVIHAAT